MIIGSRQGGVWCICDEFLFIYFGAKFYLPQITQLNILYIRNFLFKIH